MKNRLIKILLIISGFAGLFGIILSSYNNNIVYFVTPSEILKKKDGFFRLGGTASNISFKNGEYNFKIIDDKNFVISKFKGIPPDIFREKQGVVVEGIWENKKFKASKLFAKHDETYKPPC